VHDSIPVVSNVESTISRSEATLSIPNVPPTPREEQTVVTVVARDPSARESIKQLLEKAGYQATNGKVQSENALFATTDEIVPLAELERRAIDHALRVTGGRVARAAKLLGIGRATLYRRLAGRSANNSVSTTENQSSPQPFH